MTRFVLPYDHHVQSYRPKAGPYVDLLHKDFGAAGNGTTDDTAAINAFLTAAAGKKGVIPPGVYKVTGRCPIPANTTIEFMPGAQIIQYVETYPAMEAAGDYVVVVNPSLKHATTTARRTNGLLELFATSHSQVWGGVLGDSAGLGLFIARAFDVQVFGTKKLGVGKADAFHVMNGGGSGHVSKNVQFFGCYGEGADDDIFAVQSYSGSGQLICENIAFFGCNAKSGAARAFVLSGKGCKIIGGSAVNMGGLHAVAVMYDSTFVTMDPVDCVVEGVSIQPGTGADDASHHGIYVYRGTRIRIDKCDVNWTKGNSIFIDADVYGASRDVRVTDCDIVGDPSSGSNAIYFRRVKGAKARSNSMKDSRKQAVIFEECGRYSCLDNDVEEWNRSASANILGVSVINGTEGGRVLGNKFTQTVNNFDHVVSVNNQGGKNILAENDYSGVNVGLMAGTFENVTAGAASTIAERRDRGTRVDYASAAPASGTWSVGDMVWNTAPSELGTAGSKYTIAGWRCVAAGSPGTWLQRRELTGN
jgi:hypothetical protein